MTKSSEYHLPSDAYWVCSDKYNGLSSKSKYVGATNRVLSRNTQVSVLRDKSSCSKEYIQRTGRHNRGK
jgi:hypothetical protein